MNSYAAPSSATPLLEAPLSAIPIVHDTIADDAHRLWAYHYHPRCSKSATPTVNNTNVHSLSSTHIVCGPINTDPIVRGRTAGDVNHPPQPPRLDVKRHECGLVVDKKAIGNRPVFYNIRVSSCMWLGVDFLTLSMAGE